MSDDLNPHDENCPPHPHMHLPADVAAALHAATADHQHAHETQAMKNQADRMRVEAFIDGLDVSQCMALRQILAVAHRRRVAEFVDGQVFHHMRVVLGVDPTNGEPSLPSGEGA